MPLISALRRLSVPKLATVMTVHSVKNINGFGDGVQLLKCLPLEYKATLKPQKQIKTGMTTVHSGGQAE